VVGAGIPIAVGAALGFQMKGEDRVAVPFLGDGATNTGNSHEGLNMAAVWKPPVVFAVENSRWADSTNGRESTAVSDLSARAAGYDIPGVRVDGNDVLAVYEAATQAVARAPHEGPCGAVAWLPSAMLTLAYDPRALNADQAARFLGAVRDALEQPQLHF
jgi:TPP-dependent pyruvate/acetoin dehydrogenase alpha subunit